jgi:hypothetical protein
MKKHRPDVTMRLLTRDSADAAGNMLRFMKVAAARICFD